MTNNNKNSTELTPTGQLAEDQLAGLTVCTDSCRNEANQENLANLLRNLELGRKKLGSKPEFFNIAA